MITIYLDFWKNYCNLIRDNTNSANEQNQPHEDKIYEINVISAETKDLKFEHMKWFDLGHELFERMSTQAINKWIMILKRIIRSSKQKNCDERQNKIKTL